MATFNSMPGMAGTAPVHDALGLNVNAAGLEGFDQDLAFDDSLLDNVNGLPPLPFTPAYDFENNFTFEDPFSYSSRPYEAITAAAIPEEFNEGSSPQELDNKLLGFSAPLAKASIIDESGQFAEAGMTAELYGMFFVAEDVFGGESTGRPLELTCYRRNLWQCSGQITLPRQVTHIVNEQGRQVPIFDLAASITAMESIEGKTTEIISIPWKSSNPSAGEETKVASAPPNVPVDLTGGQEIDNNRVSVQVSWKRLQFKHATANNGRRKGLQQHYVVQINLVGKTKSGEWVKIAEIQSGPVIVRGRSPRNFDSRRDVPLSSDKKFERRNTDASLSGKSERTDVSQNVQRFQTLGNVQDQQPGDWSSTPAVQPFSQPAAHPNKKLAVSPNMTRPPVPGWSADNAGGAAVPNKPVPATPRPAANSLQQRATAPNTLPINLSLSEDERSPNRSNSDSTASPQFSKTMPAPGQGGVNSPSEDDELLYEYFPLSLDDWMPPVDAIYRPHVVHHTVVPPEVKAQQTRSKTKRYFIAD